MGRDVDYPYSFACQKRHSRGSAVKARHPQSQLLLFLLFDSSTPVMGFLTPEQIEHVRHFFFCRVFVNASVAMRKYFYFSLPSFTQRVS